MEDKWRDEEQRKIVKWWEDMRDVKENEAARKRKRGREGGREKWERGHEINEHSSNERVLMFISQVSAHWTTGW